MKIKSFLDHTVATISLVATLILVAQPVGARMIGGPSCVQSKVKISSKKPLVFSYWLTCGDERAEVAESPGDPKSPIPLVSTPSVIAKVRRAGNTYMASDGFAGVSGKSIFACTGNHLPQGTEGEGQGKLNVLAGC